MQHIDNIRKLFDKTFVEHPLIESFDAGDIYLSSGYLVACDPLITSDKAPFDTRFPTGKFPVCIHKEKGSGRIAYVEIVFSNRGISRWELALCKGQLVEDLSEGEIFGYPVESGMGCVMDVETQQLLNELEQNIFRTKGTDFRGIYEDFFHEYFFRDNEMVNQFALLFPNDKKLNNIVAFETGYGEGFYAGYIAFDQDHHPVKFVSEFIEVV